MKSRNLFIYMKICFPRSSYHFKKKKTRSPRILTLINLSKGHRCCYFLFILFYLTVIFRQPFPSQKSIFFQCPPQLYQVRFPTFLFIFQHVSVTVLSTLIEQLDSFVLFEKILHNFYLTVNILKKNSLLSYTPFYPDQVSGNQEFDVDRACLRNWGASAPTYRPSSFLSKPFHLYLHFYY